MRNDLSKIHFQGARILRVIENTTQISLTFEVSYPLAEMESDFRLGRFIFWGLRRYSVSEPSGPEPTIQSVEIIEVNSTNTTIHIKTDYGLREVSCISVIEEGPFPEPGAAPDGGPVAPLGNPEVTDGPPSVS